MEKRSVSLVLGSGGARGLAHIGVINWLNSHGFEIRSIAGSSMGALIGGIYATGKLDIYTDWVIALEKIDVIRLLDFSFRRNSLFKGERIISTLQDLVGECNIEELPVAYTAVATDAQEQKEVWLNKGPLFNAIRASISIPTIFTPYNYMGKQFLDGSLVSPVPIAPIMNDKTDLTFVVNLHGKPETNTVAPELKKTPETQKIRYHQRIAQFIASLQPSKLEHVPCDMGLFEVIEKSMDTMQNRITSLQLDSHSADAIIDIPCNICAFFEFYRASELIEIGRQKADETLSRFL